MTLLNKNLIRRRIIIFLLLALYMGLCFEAAAFPPVIDMMALGELPELNGGYSIGVVEIDTRGGGEALFVLRKERRALDVVFVSSGERFSLDGEEIFHFEAALDSVFSDADAKIVQLTDYNCELKGGSYGNDD